MSSSFSDSNSGDSGVSFSGLRLEFLSSSSESLHMELKREVREDLPCEHAESFWLKRTGYEWVVDGVRTSFSKYRWSRLLKAWLRSVYLFERKCDLGTVCIEQVSGVECVCHGREGAKEDFFYMYSCMFVKLHIRLPLNDFTMGVPRLRMWCLPNSI